METLRHVTAILGFDWSMLINLLLSPQPRVKTNIPPDPMVHLLK